MYMGSKRVRMFLIAGPRVERVVNWADVSYQYLVALRVSGVRPRAIPIGGMQLPARAKEDRAWAHWLAVADAFEGDLDPKVNVVCLPLGLPLGRAVLARDFIAPREGTIKPPEPKDPNAVVYEPGTALSGLFTEGMVNIAITGRLGTGALLVEKDLEMLHRYALVICPEMKDVTWLETRGFAAEWCSPPQLAVDAGKMPCFAEVLDA